MDKILHENNMDESVRMDLFNSLFCPMWSCTTELQKVFHRFFYPKARSTAKRMAEKETYSDLYLIGITDPLSGFVTFHVRFFLWCWCCILFPFLFRVRSIIVKVFVRWIYEHCEKCSNNSSSLLDASRQMHYFPLIKMRWSQKDRITQPAASLGLSMSHPEKIPLH